MNGVAEIAAKYGNDVAELAARYGQDCIDAIKKYGLDAVNVMKKYGEDALTAIKRGIDPVLIAKLDEYKIKPSDYERFRILSKMAAESALATIASIKNTLKTCVESIFEKVKSVFRNGDELKIATTDDLEFSLVRSEVKAELTAGGMSDEAAESALNCLEDGCFTGDTLVITEPGKKRIDQISEGDKVLAKNIDSGAVGYQLVEKVYIKSSSEFVLLELDGKKVKATGSHLFFTGEGWWKAAENLRAGDLIVTASGEMAQIDSVEKIIQAEPERIYNLNVANYHTYYVGNSELLVHNNCYEDMTNAFKVAVEDALASGVTDPAELKAIGKAAARELIDGFNWGAYLRGLIGDPPTGMIRPHAHHILFKEGFGATQKALVEEGQQILSSYGIDAIKGTENLVWAPNVAGKHTTVALEQVVDTLRNIKNAGGTKEEIIAALKKLGEIAAK